MKKIIALVIALMFATVSFAATTPVQNQPGTTVKHQPAKKKMKAKRHHVKKASKTTAAPAAK